MKDTLRKKALSGDRDALKDVTLALIKRGNKRNENIAANMLFDAYSSVHDAETALGKHLIDGSDLFKEDKDIGFTWMAISGGGNTSLSLDNGEPVPDETAPAPKDAPQGGDTASGNQKYKSNLRRIDPSVSSIDPMEELNKLIGLENVKTEIAAQTSRIEFEKMRRQSGLASSRSSVHFIFTGNPGTGKTTVARILGRLLKKIGHLQSGHVIEVSVPELIGQFVGETPQKVLAALQEAVGGVLFIDEAYGLLSSTSGNGDAYGEQAITTLLKFMEDNRDNITIIAAGYPEDMHRFLESNPGFKSRFSEIINFHDYGPQDLCKIYALLAKDADYQISSAVMLLLEEKMRAAPSLFEKNFPNGRFARNLFEDTTKYMALRVTKLTSPTKSDLSNITAEDVEAAYLEAQRMIKPVDTNGADKSQPIDKAKYNHN